MLFYLNNPNLPYQVSSAHTVVAERSQSSANKQKAHYCRHPPNCSDPHRAPVEGSHESNNALQRSNAREMRTTDLDNPPRVPRKGSTMEGNQTEFF